jgi:hypothetical protein
MAEKGGEKEMKIALAFGFGLESLWMREILRQEKKQCLLIVCKSYKDHLPKRINVLLKGEKYIVLRRKFEEKWEIREDYNPHRFSCTSYTNTIIEWAKQQSSRPFDILYLGRRLQDLKQDETFKECKDFVFSPPAELEGFTLNFPYWDWSREGNVLLPHMPELEVKA